MLKGLITMLIMNRKLKELASQGKDIRVAIVGVGKMGKSLIIQMTRIKGMQPSLIVSRNVEKAVDIYLSAGISRHDIVISNSLGDINYYLEKGKYLITEDLKLATRANLIDALVDATGVPEVGAEISLDSIDRGKHIIMLNVEADCVVGPILYKKAREAGIVYTGTAGDEPGAVMDLYDFAMGLGFQVLAIGKGKNNPLDLSANPDTLYKRALDQELNPKMLTGFVDGTNSMIEMTCMANATGFIPDIRGGHGINSNIEELTDKLCLKEQGGILDSYGIVDYVRGIAPGVFAIFTSKLAEVKKQLNYLNMGPGPNFLLYRPYHLTSLETPITIFNACINGEATIAPTKGIVAETIAIAKKDLKVGDSLDGIGGYTVYGEIEKYDIAKGENLVPIGLIDKQTKVIQNIGKGQAISYDMIEINKESKIYGLRKLQDSIMG